MHMSTHCTKVIASAMRPPDPFELFRLCCYSVDANFLYFLRSAVCRIWNSCRICACGVSGAAGRCWSAHGFWPRVERPRVQRRSVHRFQRVQDQGSHVSQAHQANLGHCAPRWLQGRKVWCCSQDKGHGTAAAPCSMLRQQLQQQVLQLLLP
jgi:hypothetical protein